jgi:hypothetical protein
MADEAKTYSLAEAQVHFAKSLNGKVWELLQKENRSKADDQLMIYAAHASCYHWLIVGTGLHHQRAEWLLSHVFAVLGMVNPAISHASRCLELTNQYADLMQDFDRAYAYEAVARANALAGNQEEARMSIQKAEELAQLIANAEDKSIFMSDFNGGNWNNLK